MILEEDQPTMILVPVFHRIVGYIALQFPPTFQSNICWDCHNYFDEYCYYCYHCYCSYCWGSWSSSSQDISIYSHFEGFPRDVLSLDRE